MATSMPTLGKLAKLSSSKGSAKAPRSMPEKMWMAGGALVAVLIVLIGYVTLIRGQQNDTTAVRDSITTAEQTNAGLQSQITTLQAESKNLPKYEAALAKARLALPSTAGASDFVRTLQTLCTTTATKLGSVTFGNPVPVAATAGAAAATPAAGATTTPAASDAGTATGSGAPLYSMAISTQVTGSENGITAFLQQLQSVQPRAVLVSTIAVTHDTSGGTSATSLSLTMQAFLAPTNITVPVVATPSASPTAGS